MSSLKRNNWFLEYQEIPEINVKGKRNIADRIEYYDPKDFESSSVVDFGCNVGQMSFQAKLWGARSVLGVE